MALLMGDVRSNDWVELDNNLASIQQWAGKVDGLNAAERLGAIETGLSGLASLVWQTGMGALWYTNTPPAGFLLCDGSAVSRTTYAALFALWGVTWGAGNGSTTFNVPDLRQRFPLGKAASGTGSTLAGTGGTINHTHSNGSLDVSGNTNDATLETSEVQAGTGITVTNDGVHNHSGAGLGVTGSTGSNNPPYLVVQFIVKV